MKNQLSFLLILSFSVFFVAASLPVSHSSIDCEVNLPHSVNAKNKEIFKVESKCELIFSHLRVYNRWGNLVFEEKNKNKGWVVHKDKKAREGSYFYKLDYQTEFDTEEHQLKGYLTVIK